MRTSVTLISTGKFRSVTCWQVVAVTLVGMVSSTRLRSFLSFFFFFFGYLEGLCRYRLALVCLPIVFVCSISSYFSPLLEKRSCIM